MARWLAKLKPKRRWAQISLRTMLVLVTLLCIALAMWVVPAERQRRVVAAIKALGATVVYKKHNQGFPITILRRWFPADYFDDVGTVRVWTDAGLAHLRELKGMQFLDLSGTSITDSGLAHLQGLTSLRSLFLGRTFITDAGLCRLQGLTGIRVLDLEDTQVTDAGLVNLEGLLNLERLWLRETRVTNTGTAQLKKALPNCQIFAGPRPVQKRLPALINRS